MSYYRLIGMTMAMLGISAVLAATAAAEESSPAVWLASGESVASSLAISAEGEVTIEDTKTAGMKCSVILVGTVTTGGEGEITAVLSLSGTEVSLSTPLLCKSHKTCEESASDIEMAPEKLPWRTRLLISESGHFPELVREPTFWLSCLVLGIKESEECTWAANSQYEVVNVVGGVEAVGGFSPKGTCSIGGAETGSIEFAAGNLMLLTGGGTLSASGSFVKNGYEGEGTEKEIQEGEEKEEGEGVPGISFEFNNGTIKDSVVCVNNKYAWSRQLRGPRFSFVVGYGGCTYNSANMTVTNNCLNRLKLPIPFTGNEWRTTLDVIPSVTSCEIKLAPETGCQVKIVNGVGNEDLSTVYEEDAAGGLRAIIVVRMIYSSTGCKPPIEATGRTEYRLEKTFGGVRVIR